jgi:hypothetical protein
MEDDWVFVQNNFDQILVDFFNKKENCSYVCGLINNRIQLSISNGLTSSLILHKLNGIKLNKKQGYNCYAQEQFSCIFKKTGVITDITEKFCVPFNNLGELRVFEKTMCNERYEYISHIPNDKPILMMPIQFLNEIN